MGGNLGKNVKLLIKDRKRDNKICFFFSSSLFVGLISVADMQQSEHFMLAKVFNIALRQ